MNETKELTARSRSGQEFKFSFLDESHNLKRKNGTWYIELHYNQVVEKYGMDVPATFAGKLLMVEIVEQVKVKGLRENEAVQKEQKRKEELTAIMQAPIVKLTYVIGCDCTNTEKFDYNFDQEVDFETLLKRRESDEKLIKEVISLIEKDKNIEMNIPANLGSYGGYEIEGEKLAKLLNAARANLKTKEQVKENRKIEKEKKVEEENAAAIAEAKKTGKNVYIRIVGGYDGDQASPGEELGWVNVVEVATPDGNIVEKNQACH